MSRLAIRNGTTTTGTEVCAYAVRNQHLRLLGYASYIAYRSSPTWRRIRSKYLKGNCRLCDRFRATQLHHLQYDVGTLKYGSDRFLVPLCNRCHECIEFTHQNTKATLQQANLELARLIQIPRKKRYQAIQTKLDRLQGVPTPQGITH